jgi:hypothetical protein
VFQRIIVALLLICLPLSGVSEAKKKAKKDSTEEAEEKAPKAKNKKASKSENKKKPEDEKPKKTKEAKPAKERSAFDPFSESAVGFRGVGEIWQESAVVMVHRSSRFGGTGFFSTSVTEMLGLEFELGYNRMVGTAIDPTTNQRTGGQATLELVPVSMDATIRSEGPRSEVFFGVGPAFVAFNDRSPTNAISGMKLGLDMRLGVRIRTKFLQESIRPGAGGFKRMDVELMLGRRQHQLFGIGSGLDLSAWRVGGGLVCRL